MPTVDECVSNIAAAMEMSDPAVSHHLRTLKNTGLIVSRREGKEILYNGKCYRGIAEKIKEYVTEDDMVLECACGTGLLTLPMAQKCKKLIATDYSVGMLRQAKKKVAKYSNTKVGKVNILELPFEDDKFDVVVAANVIHLLDITGRV